MAENTFKVENYEEMKKSLEANKHGFFLVPWKCDAANEDAVRIPHNPSTVDPEPQTLSTQRHSAYFVSISSILNHLYRTLQIKEDCKATIRCYPFEQNTGY